MPLDDPKVLQSILSEAFHPTPGSQKILREVLGEDVSTYRQYSKAISSWRWPLWGSALEDMPLAKESGWERDKIFGPSEPWMKSGGGEGPNYSMVQIALNKERSVLKYGGMVLKAKEGKIVLMVEAVYKAFSVVIHSTESGKELAEKFFKDIDAWVSKHNFYKGQKIRSDGKFLNLSDVSYDDLILPEKTKHAIFINVKQMIERMADYEKYGIPAKRGVILAGPPGCGKTLAARILAKSLPCTFIWCSTKDIMEEGFEGIFEQARELAPTVVLMEDADGFGIDRRLGGMNPRLSELLNLLDGVEENKGVITILSSNYAEMLDCALTNRPGRFDLKVFVGLPGADEAQEILRRNLEKRNVVFKGNPGVFRTIASALVGRGASGAHVVDVVNSAMALAVERGRGTGPRLVIEEKDLQDSAATILESLNVNREAEKAVVESGVMKWGQWGPGWKFGMKE
jgi:AAA+ superfamily predicted ATPase